MAAVYPFTAAQAAQAVNGSWHGGEPEQLGEIGFDSRLLESGSTFIALSAKRDGHDFLAAASKAGAGAAIVSRLSSCRIPQLLVDDTLQALHRLAGWHRGSYAGELVVVTGSNGKSTTKEMLRAIFARWVGGDKTIASRDNHNNHIGLPLVLLSIRAAHQFAILEAGMNHPGEIASLTRMARPTLGVITNAGRAHLGQFDSVAQIARAKGELLEKIRPRSPVVLNADDANFDLWREMAAGREVLAFSHAGNSRAVCRRIPDRDFIFSFNGSSQPREVVLQVAGAHNEANALAAATAAWRLGVPFAVIRAGLEDFAGVPGRQEISVHSDLVLIDDSYNASPESFAAAVDQLASRPEPIRILAMGDMLDLGSQAPQLHELVVRQAVAAGISHILGFGELSVPALALAGERGHACASKDAMVAQARRLARGPCAVLVKGSRAMGMEEVAAGLAEAR